MEGIALSEPIRTLTPNRRVFVWRPTLRGAAILAVLALAGIAFSPVSGLEISVATGLIVLVWGALVGLIGIQRYVRFTKTRYRLYRDRIVFDTGGIVSDSTIDLKFENVTQLTLWRPYIEHRLYQTGHIRIQAAGSMQAEVKMESIDAPVETFESLQRLLVDNGFSLQRETTVQVEKPGLVGCLYDLGAPVLGTALVILAYLPDLLSGWAAMMEIQEFSSFVESLVSSQPADPTRPGAIIAVTALALLLLAGGMGFLVLAVLKLLDLLERTYTIHDDVIEYEDGFLTTSHSLIPFENLSDVEVSQTAIQRLLGVSTVAVSCQGAGADIRLTAVPNGDVFKSNLEKLIDQVGARHRAERTPEAEHFEDAAQMARRMRGMPAIEARMSWKPAILSAAAVCTAAALGTGLLLIPMGIQMDSLMLPLGFMAGVFALSLVWAAGTIGLKVYANRYRIDSNKVVKIYELLSTKQTEFTLDKVSYLEFRTGPFDRIFGTAKITFRSIGSLVPMSFDAVESADRVLSGILERMEIDESQADALRPEFSLMSMLRSLDGWLVFLLIVVVLSLAPLVTGFVFTALLVPLWLVAMLARVLYLRVSTARIRLWWSRRHLVIERGIFVRKRIFLPRDHIRGIGARFYLGGEQGFLKVRSGGNVVESIAYLDAPWSLQDRLDQDLWADDGRASFVPEVSIERKPEPIAAALRGLFLSLYTVVLAPFFVVVMGWKVWRAKHTTYQLQRPRVAQHTGIFLKSRETVLVSRIDHLTHDRGLVNRLTSTGTIGVRTIGSTGTDLQILDIPEPIPLYEAIEARTREHD